MHEFQGDLLIGGARLKQIHGELADEQPPQGDSHEWTLAGQLHLTAEQSGQIEVHRPYRLVLSDGRAGQVPVTKKPVTRTVPQADSRVASTLPGQGGPASSVTITNSAPG